MNGQPIGHYGDASAFSLHATKLLHTAEGGFVVTRADKTLALRRMRSFGIERGRGVGPGLNGKMSEIHAAMGLALLPDLPGEIAARLALRQRYDRALAGLPGLRLHGTRPGAGASLCYYTLRMHPDLRMRLHLSLAEQGILARDHFPLLCGPGTAWENSGIITAGGGPAQAPELGPEILCLPLQARVTDQDADRITAICETSGAERSPP